MPVSLIGQCPPRRPADGGKFVVSPCSSVPQLRFRRKDAFRDQGGTLGDSMGKVYGQHSDRGTPDCGSSNQYRTLPPEVPRPFLPPRIEEPGSLTCLRIDASQIGPFVIVVGQTCKSQIRVERETAVLFRDDMVELEAG